jgi:hypothetical protein
MGLKHAIHASLLLLLGVPYADAADTHLLHYTARLHGLPLLDITFCIALTDTAYSAAISARTLGLAEFLVHGRSEGHAHGAIDGLRVEPAAYDEQGRLSGENHKVVISYPHGDPVLVDMTPPPERTRLPIPADTLAGAMDGLSAIVLETLVASRTGACQGEAMVYDGYQLRRGTTHTAGTEILKADSRSIFAGKAIRCDTESVMLAGYLKDKPVKSQARPRFSTAWLGPLAPGGLDLPLRLSFDADFLGAIIVDLDRADTAAAPGCTQ